MLERITLAISIDGTSARIIACQKRSVIWWADLPLDQRLFRQGFLVDVAGFAAALSTSEKLHSFRKARVLAALPGFQHFARVLRVPKEARKDIRVVVDGEVRRSIPDSDRTMFVFSQCFGSNKALQQSVFVLAVPRQPIITLLEAFRAAQLRPAVFDLRPLALARAVNQADAIIGNAESGALDVVIVRGDVPVMMRSLYLGEDYNNVEFVNGRLVEELARTVTHFNATSQDGPLAPDTGVYLTGRGAGDTRLPAAIEDSIPYPLRSVEPPFSVPDDFPVSEFAVPLGLMLK